MMSYKNIEEFIKQRQMAKKQSEIINWINKVIDFIKTGSFGKKENSHSKVYWTVKPFRVVWYTVKGIGKHEVILRSAALTIYTVMSLIPVAALIFGILKGFGFEKNLTDYLYSSFSQYSNVIDILMGFVNRMLEKTRGGVIAAVGVVVLLWSVIKLFGNIEDAFNSIWEVRKSRDITQKFSDYVALIFVSPILLVASISLGTVIRNLLSFLSISWLIDILLFLSSLVLVCLLFAFVYWMMPNTKVKFKGAIIAGMLAGTTFYIFSVVYFYIQGRVSSYNAIYGTFAAIPLFLTWMQTSWQILLIGGELSFAYQNTDRYEQERLSANMDNIHRRKVLVATMLSVAKHYIDNDKTVNEEDIADELNLPVRVIREMIFKLERAGLIVQVENDKSKKQNAYVPAKDVHTVKISDIIDGVENNIPKPDFSVMPEMQKVNSILDKMSSSIYNSNSNVYLTELIKM